MENNKFKKVNSRNIVPDLVIERVRGNNLENVSASFVKSMAIRFNINDEALLGKILSCYQSVQCSVGDGIYMPHIKLSNIKTPIKIFVKLNTPLDIDTIDNCPINIIYILITPMNESSLHLRMTAEISRKLKNKDFLGNLLNAESEDEIISVFSNIDYMLIEKKRIGLFNVLEQGRVHAA